MNKTLVEIYVPLLERSYDVFIPRSVQLYEVLVLIKRAVSELSEGRFIPDPQTLLCRKETGEILDINKSADELGLETGSRLMLI